MLRNKNSLQKSIGSLQFLFTELTYKNLKLDNLMRLARDRDKWRKRSANTDCIRFVEDKGV